ncbi:MAG: alpha-amylase family glycosyl hydrolase [Anaerolineales bacterium]
MTNRLQQPWWQKAVIYQIYPRSFMDANADGIGDLEGIIQTLDYLSEGTQHSLGIDAVWISPFYPSPMADFGYDVADYCNVDALFGDLASFDRLVAACHQRGIKVIVDYVPNHTSDQHAWFQASRSSRNSPKRDWYIWRDARSDGSPPNNWGSVFGGPAWTWDADSGQYYLHQFLREQPELNWRNPEVRAAMLDVLHFWLRRGVDGFRMDVVAFLIKDAELRDNPPNLGAAPGLHPDDLFGRQLHLYSEDQDEVQEIIREFRRVVDQYDDRCVIGELFYELPRWVRYYGENGNGLHLPFNFRLMMAPWQAASIQRSVDEFEAALPPFGWPNYVLGNHDQPRLASRIGQEQARVAAMLLLTLRGTPTLYYGDELGMENGVIPPELVQDPQGLRLGADRTRDIARTPMLWDATPQAGFSAGKSWLPVAADYATRNAAAQANDPSSILSLYRQLLRLRKRIPALLAGEYRSLESGNEDCFTFLRSHLEGEYLVALNFSDQEQQVKLEAAVNGNVVLSTYLDDEQKLSGADVMLRANEGVLIRVR